MTKKAEELTHFYSDGILGGQGICYDFPDDSIENEDDYIERRRERAMYDTLRKIIENELDDTKRDVFVSMFFRGEKPTEIAKRLSVSLSMVYKHYHYAFNTIEKNLKYVFYYCTGCSDKLIPLGDMQKRARKSAESVYTSAIPLRLRRLMRGTM